MRPEISVAAEADLRQVHEYGRKAYGDIVARNYLADLLLAIDRIADWPLAYQLRHEVRPPVRLFSHAAHNVFYDALTDKVSIVRVLHHSADWVHIL